MDDDHPRAVLLVGEPDGLPIRCPVRRGRSRVGSTPDNEVVIPVAGVSRHHAVLDLDQGRLLVEDAGSKNGVFVNSRRVQRAEVHVGDALHIGPALLRVEAADPDDAELAFPGPPGPADDTPEDRERTRTRERERDSAPVSWLELVGRTAHALLRGGDSGVAAALTELGSGLSAVGAALVERGPGGEPVVRAARGELPPLDADEEVAELLVAAGSSGRPAVHLLEREPPIAVALGPGPDRPGLVVSGDFPHRHDCGALLATVAPLLGTNAEPHGRREGQGGAAGSPALVIPASHVVGHSPAMAAVYRQLRQLARGDLPVLLTGETGVGKEHVARILHASSDRARGPFVAVNCAAIPAELLEAELFGIERGVATGVEARRGKLELAAGGFVFLDEIADMSAGLQAKLLRALQEREVHPLGASAPRPVDVRFVSATNTDLAGRIAAGSFRRDLYYRIAGYTLHVPPLRNRRGDIPALVEHFVARFAAEVGKPVRGMTLKALRALAEAPWPGNVRELEHEVRRLVYLCPPHQAVDASLLSDAVLAPAPLTADAPPDPSSDLTLAHHVADLERRLITLALARTRGSQRQAARLLGISRNGLAQKLERLGGDEG